MEHRHPAGVPFTEYGSEQFFELLLLKTDRGKAAAVRFRYRNEYVGVPIGTRTQKGDRLYRKNKRSLAVKRNIFQKIFRIAVLLWKIRNAQSARRIRVKA